MNVFQSTSFAHKVKKLKARQKQHLDAAVKDIISAPHIGVEKRGDLKGVFVYKFKIQGVLYLLSYRFSDEELELIMLGPHENYYRDLKSYLKKK
jgi:mRNA-degrading endonuclease RelE of RelBE toxin-antitoxin system